MNEEFEKIRASIVAITPQIPQFSETMADQNDLGFDLLTDHGNEYADKLGLKFALPKDLAALSKQFGIDLPQHNDGPSWNLPIPGRFIIDKQGIVRSIAVDPDYTRRPEPAETGRT